VARPVTNEILDLVDPAGPYAYSASGILQPNTMYWIDAVNLWTTPTDGFNGTFMTLSLSEPSTVPEPGQVAASILLLIGIGGYMWLKRRKAAKSA
jgi:hypothetical protein